MDGLVKQMRVRFAAEGDPNTRRVPIHKTYSFKGEKKKVHNWFQRQFSGQMKYDDHDDIEHAAAVAAVACAITSLEESNRKKNKDGTENETHLTKTRSKRKKEEDIAISVPGPVIASRTSKREDSRKSFDDLEVPDMKEQMASPSNDKKPKYVPSMKRVPTDKHPLYSSGNENPESALPKTAFPKHTQQSTKKPETSVLSKPAAQSPSKPSVWPAEGRRMGSTKPPSETEADSWERAHMSKIKIRYERLNATIDSWENKKKEKAKLKLDKSEKDKEKSRARALEYYRNEMESIGQIAGGARAQAQEKRRKEELKVKEKANRIRSTGEIPSSSCLCF